MNDRTDSRTAETKQKGTKNLLGIGLALLLVAAAFFSGVQIGTGQMNGAQMEAGLFSLFARTPEPSEEVDLGEFWHVWNLLEEKFVSSCPSISGVGSAR